MNGAIPFLLFFWMALAGASGCGGDTHQGATGHIAPVQSEETTANEELLRTVAKAFYRTHTDDYDMLVIWGAPEFSPGHSFYLPIRNDVPGIGYRHIGPELFDRSVEYGSSRLQGMIWMGPDWRNGPTNDGTPGSASAILAHETGHRWSCLVHFDEPKQGLSSALLGDTLHWSFFLETGADPMGGNEWTPLEGPLYQARPVNRIRFCPLSLYLMGLLPPESVPPLKLLVNIRDELDRPVGGITPYTRRVSTPVTVKADVEEVSIAQIAAVEGPRDADVGFSAQKIRQAWVYVYRDSVRGPSPLEMETLESLRSRWGAFFAETTSGLSSMDTTL